MTREEKRQLLQPAIDAILAVNRQQDALEEVVGPIVESPLWDALCQMEDALVSAVAVALGDGVSEGVPRTHSSWLRWFVWENECGARVYEAGYDGSMKPIRTVDDLLDLIEEGSRREQFSL